VRLRRRTVKLVGLVTLLVVALVGQVLADRPMETFAVAVAVLVAFGVLLIWRGRGPH
jgi:Ca2+/Na+ antiporter